MDFVDWNGCPALLGRTEAKALLEPGAEWTSVDLRNVQQKGRLMSEASWRERFSNFDAGLAKLPALDQPGLANSEANSIQLFVQDGKEYRSVRLYLTDGGLQLLGHDMGPAVERIWGDDDYEFWVEIKPHAMRQLAFALLRDRYAGRKDAVSEFREFCKQNAIEHEFDNWV